MPTAESKVEEYRVAVLRVYAIAVELARLPLEDLLADIEKADALASIVDPTLYRQKGPAMKEDEHLLRTALALRSIGVKLLGREKRQVAEAEKGEEKA